MFILACLIDFICNSNGSFYYLFSGVLLLDHGWALYFVWLALVVWGITLNRDLVCFV